MKQKIKCETIDCKNKEIFLYDDKLLCKVCIDNLKLLRSLC